MKPRAAAKAAGATRYFTGKPCPSGHVADRMVSNGRCVSCLDQAKKTPEARKQAARYAADRYRAEPERFRQGAREYRARHPKKIKEINSRRAGIIKLWHQTHPDRVKDICEKYRASPKGRAARDNNTRVRRRRMTVEVPAWADLQAIASLYAQANHLTLETGVLHVVDHIVPIAGDGVSGLHVENNLQVITLHENLVKGDRYSH